MEQQGVGQDLVDQVLHVFADGRPGEGVQRALLAELSALAFFVMTRRDLGAPVAPMCAVLADGLERRRTPEADVALAALALLGPDAGHPEFASSWECRRAAGDVDPVAMAVGQDRVIRGVRIDHVCGDGSNFVLDIANPAGNYTAVLFVDHNAGGVAKDTFIGPPLGDVLANYENPDDGFIVAAIDLTEARWRARIAIEKTATSRYVPSLAELAEQHALIERRFESLPHRELTPPEVVALDPPELSVPQRIGLLDDFITSPECQQLPPDQAPAIIDVLNRWLDHATEFATGSPTRVSAVLVESFFGLWLPSTADDDPSALMAAPMTIEAWLHFAARTTGMPDRWLDDALDAVAHHAPNMFALAAAIEEQVGEECPAPTSSNTVGRVVDLADLVNLGEPLGAGAPRDAGAPVGGEEASRWRKLEPTDATKHVPVSADLTAVPVERRTKTTLIYGRAAALAAIHLGPSFAQPAIDLAVAIGAADPCLWDKTQIASWPGAIVWLLAEDNDAFHPRTPGRRRDDLAAVLPMTRATYESKAKKIRATLTLPKAALQIDY